MLNLVVARILLALALAIDAWLAWHALTERLVAGCGGLGGCAEVLATRWAYWAGIPVSIPAMVVHGSLLVSYPRLKRLVPALVLLVWGAALWFLALQAIVIRHYCLYCLTAHALGVVAGFLLIKCVSQPWTRQTRLSAICGLLILAGGQLAFHPDFVDRSHSAQVAADSPDATARPKTRLYQSPFGSVDPGEVPHIGNPDANHVAILLFDFTCEYCRKSHPLLMEAMQGRERDLCLVLLPVALEATCNPSISKTQPEHEGACEYARLALALWRHSPDDFHAFCNAFITTDRSVRSVSEAHAWAEKHLGRAGLGMAMADPWVEAQLRKNLQFYGAAVHDSNLVKMPKLLLAGQIISGVPGSADSYRDWFRQYIQGGR